ncbi:MAG TPA: hypothetical protein PLN56_09320 [Methanoregulaceae archaeon]|nr:MAG: hypothetical protein IPI71_05625 [Methanolinea sp.]HON82357.1 hypothetical protein [Methanoregulaceae archaeon]HPD11176.1 hypothetical protein [Methanoregulaceae archaeon]HRT16174.1 hypothetical protein [Methanoregulaceae archaeon]HRU31743.1 hypothetical protein [Methanoregulaceae archaeon]
MKQSTIDVKPNDAAVSHLIEYLIITGVLMLLIVITLPVVPNVLIERPTEQLSSYAFTDIANGISTRIVDMYAMSGSTGTYSRQEISEAYIESKFNLPDLVANRDYYVKVSGSESTQNITVFRGNIRSVVSIAGIGTTRHVTTPYDEGIPGHSVTKIIYDTRP